MMADEVGRSLSIEEKQCVTLQFEKNMLMDKRHKDEEDKKRVKALYYQIKKLGTMDSRLALRNRVAKSPAERKRASRANKSEAERAKEVEKARLSMRVLRERNKNEVEGKRKEAKVKRLAVGGITSRKERKEERGLERVDFGRRLEVKLKKLSNAEISQLRNEGSIPGAGSGLFRAPGNSDAGGTVSFFEKLCAFFCFSGQDCSPFINSGPFWNIFGPLLSIFIWKIKKKR